MKKTAYVCDCCENSCVDDPEKESFQAFPLAVGEADLCSICATLPAVKKLLDLALSARTKQMGEINELARRSGLQTGLGPRAGGTW